VAVLMSGAAVFTRDPVALADRGQLAMAASVESEVFRISLDAAPEPEAELTAGPTFTPMTVPPKVTNDAEWMRAMQVNYPAALREAGIGGEVSVWFYIDETGVPQRVQLDESSGYPVLDEAAVRVARTMRFSPALNRDQVVAVWVSLPIRFSPRSAEVRRLAKLEQSATPATESERERTARSEPPSEEPRAPGRTDGLEAALRDAAGLGNEMLRQQMLADAERLASQTAQTMRTIDQRREEIRQVTPLNLAQPVYTAMTQPPRIVNEPAVAAALRREFQRTGELSGAVNLWFYIDETGRVVKTMVDRSSGSTAVDEAALRVATVFRFAPARNRDRFVPVWISLPIQFTQG
jgi:TonB family protein